MKPVVLIAAVNGGAQQSTERSHVPITPEEIAEDAVLCAEAGASVIHFHGRDENGQNTGDPDIYADIMRRIRDRSDIVIQSTNGIGSRIDAKTGERTFPSDEERLSLMHLNPPPDFAGAATGSVDFYHPEGGYEGEALFHNSGTFLRETLKLVYGRGSTIEFEVPHVTALHRLHRYLVEAGIDPASPYIMLVIPIFPGFCPDYRSFLYLHGEAERLFPNAIRNSGAGGVHQFPAATLGLSLNFDCLRVGFEDGLTLPDGTIAARNRDLIRALADIAKVFGRRPATPAEARQILHLDRNRRAQAA